MRYNFTKHYYNLKKLFENVKAAQLTGLTKSEGGNPQIWPVGCSLLAPGLDLEQ